MNACAFDRHYFYSCLDRVEGANAAQARLLSVSTDSLCTYRSRPDWPDNNFEQRVRRVKEAIDESQRIAIRNLQRKLGGISLQDIWPVLAEICHDMALYIGGSALGGGAVGAALGAFAFGVGAIPGAAAGAALGGKIGAMLLNFIGLKSVVEYMVDSIPLAIREYEKGFSDAWGPVPSLNGARRKRQSLSHRFGDSGFAAEHFASGHEIIVVALLMGIVAYLTRGKGNLQTLLAEVGAGKQLGAGFATWLKENARKLTAIPMLQVGSKGGGQAGNKGGKAKVDPHGRPAVPERATGKNDATGNAAANSAATNVKGRLSNISPSDPAMPGPRYKLVRTASGDYKYQLPSGELRTPKGTYDFIKIGDEIKIAPPRNDGFSGHLSLSKGADVDYAGTIQFSQKGGLKSWDNNSGHYRPPPENSSVVKLPVNLFKPIE